MAQTGKTSYTYCSVAKQYPCSETTITNVNVSNILTVDIAYRI